MLSTTTSGSNYATIATNVIGSICGSGSNNAVHLDTNAVNGTTYYYVDLTVNTVGTKHEFARKSWRDAFRRHLN